jgi:uncharacterized protein
VRLSISLGRTAASIGKRSSPRCGLTKRSCTGAGFVTRALFGSIARGESKRTSDVDILIQLEPQAPVGLFEYVGITQYPADLFPIRVDVANRSSLKPLVRPTIERDAIYAF